MAEKKVSTASVELIAIHTIVRQPNADAKEETYSPGEKEKGGKLKTFKVPAAEAERLIGLGAAKRADEDEEDTEDTTPTGGAGGGTSTNPSVA